MSTDRFLKYLCTWAITIAPAGLPLTCLAQAVTPLQQLSSKVLEIQRGKGIPPQQTAVSDCSKVASGDLSNRAAALGAVSQYIFNSTYEWTAIPTDAGVCIYLRSPENRGLTQQEALSLLAASNMEFEIPQEGKSLSQPVTDDALKNARILPDAIEKTPPESDQIIPPKDKSSPPASSVPPAKKKNR